jgi:hypothetical protein
MSPEHSATCHQRVCLSPCLASVSVRDNLSTGVSLPAVVVEVEREVLEEGESPEWPYHSVQGRNEHSRLMSCFSAMRHFFSYQATVR